MTSETPRPDWLTMRPEMFDRNKLPRKYRDAPEGLFPVTDVLPPAATPKVPAATELDGQADLLTLLDGEP